MGKTKFSPQYAAGTVLLSLTAIMILPPAGHATEQYVQPVDYTYAPTQTPPIQFAQPAQPVPAQQAANQPASTPSSQAGYNNGRINILEENDYFVSNDDRHYTQGARISYTSGAVTPNGFWDTPYNFLGSFLPILNGQDRKREYEWTVVGQSIFTPTNTLAVDPSKKDRPYAAWLYTGGSLLQETKYKDYHTLENVELLVGVVGPAALGGVTQNTFHEFIDDHNSLGWSNQLKNEYGGILTYERKYRFQQKIIGNLAVDAIPEAGATVGNFLTYAEVGSMVRFGQNLGADYGPDRIRPSLSGTGWFDAAQLEGPLGWYVYAGAQGRAVAENIFLDGNNFTSSPSVDKRPLVADLDCGASLFWTKDFKTDFTFTERTKEFYTQKGHPDRFGGINLSFLFW